MMIIITRRESQKKMGNKKTSLAASLAQTLDLSPRFDEKLPVFFLDTTALLARLHHFVAFSSSSSSASASLEKKKKTKKKRVEKERGRATQRTRACPSPRWGGTTILQLVVQKNKLSLFFPPVMEMRHFCAKSTLLKQRASR